VTRHPLLCIATGVAVFAISGCDQPTQSRAKNIDASTTAQESAGRVACQDPETGKLIQPGPDVDCDLPEQAKPLKEPVVRELEGGGQALDTNGNFRQNQTEPAPANRVAIIDRETGKLMTQRPSDPLAAAQYDRSVARLNALAKRQSNAALDEPLEVEELANGVLKLNLRGRFLTPLVATKTDDGQIQVQHQD